MSEQLPADLSQIVSRYRNEAERVTPPVDRAWDRFRTHVAKHAEPKYRESRGRGTRRRWLAAGTVALLAAGVVAWFFAAPTTMWTRERASAGSLAEDQRLPASDDHAARIVLERASAEPEPIERPDAPTPTDDDGSRLDSVPTDSASRVATGGTSGAGARARARGPRSRVAGSAAGSSPSPRRESADADDLERELRLVQRGLTELREGKLEAALGRFDAHARRFPAGVLRDERDIKRIELLCRLGRVDDARRLKRRVVRRKPDYPGQRRLLRHCVEPSGG